MYLQHWLSAAFLPPNIRVELEFGDLPLALALALSLYLYLSLSFSLSLSLSLFLSLSLSLSLLFGHKNTNVPLILKVLEIIFVVWGKTYNGAFLGVFRGGLDLFDPARKKITSRTFKFSGTLIVILH
jgi:hypothetical protein